VTGPEHYVESESLLRDADQAVCGSDLERYLLAAAQVHATLAVAAATAAPLVDRYTGNTSGSAAWSRVIDRPMVPDAEIHCGTEGCTGLDGHDGECGVAW
jgi:hypothetical protein